MMVAVIQSVGFVGLLAFAYLLLVYGPLRALSNYVKALEAYHDSRLRMLECDLAIQTGDVADEDED